MNEFRFRFCGVNAQKEVLVQANTSLRQVLVQLSQHLNLSGVSTGKHLQREVLIQSVSTCVER